MEPDLFTSPETRTAVRSEIRQEMINRIADWIDRTEAADLHPRQKRLLRAALRRAYREGRL